MKKKIELNSDKVINALNALKTLPLQTNQKMHDEVLRELVQQIGPIDFRMLLKIPENIFVNQKHIIFGVIKHLIAMAKKNKWNLCKAYDYTYVYNGAYWQQIDKDDLKMFLGDVAIKMGCAEYDALHFDFKDKLLKQFLSDSHLPQHSKDVNKLHINLQNGTAEFIDGNFTLRPFSPVDFITYQLPFSYTPDAQCPLFENYLDTVLPDLTSQQVLQEFFGYIFTPLNLEKMLICIGNGSNGKSVFFNILNALLGEQNVLNYSLASFAQDYHRARLTKVLINYSSEKGTDLNPDILKRLISGEPMQAREPYGRSFTMRNRVRFIINSNELPKETDNTEAYFRRLLILPFNVTISKKDRDKELADKIIKSELPGIFNWMLVGIKRLIEQNDFTTCNAADEALADFRKQSDNVSLFVEEYEYKPCPTNNISLVDLYLKYKNFCIDDGYRALGKNKFSIRLVNKGFEKIRLNTGNYFKISSQPQ